MSQFLDGSVSPTKTVFQKSTFHPLVQQLGDIAAELGVDICLVGGYVRDRFLERKTTDIDITVIGDSIDFATRVSDKFNSKIVTYERFRTAMVPIGDIVFEFVGTRKEVYDGKSRNPTVEEGTLYDDIARRDFTCNSLAIHLGEKYTLIDIFGGLDDLENKKLKTPLEPYVTYSDDPLRMIRAARFASQLGFELEQQSFESISKLAHKIKNISQERITTEFLKIMDSPKPSIGLGLLFRSGLLEFILPELTKLQGVEKRELNGRIHGHKDQFWHTLKVVDNIAEQTDNTWLRFAALMHDIGKGRTKRFSKQFGWTYHGHEEVGARIQKQLFKKLKLPMDHLPYVEKLVRLHQRPMQLVDEGVTDSAIRRLAVTADDALEDLFTLCRADITTRNRSKEEKYLKNYTDVFDKVLEVQEKDALRAFQSPVRGDYIMQDLGIQPGRIIGHIKTQIEEAILEGDIPNEYEAALEYYDENKTKWVKEFGG
ncbi:MAG: HD domain-containing protein [Candidatus Kapaibacteriales bacterium]